MHTEKKFQNTESAFELSEDRYPHFKNHIECFSVEGDTARLDIEIDSSHHVYLKDHIFVPILLFLQHDHGAFF